MNTNGQNISTAPTYQQAWWIVTNFFLDLIFPPTCIGCDQLIDRIEYYDKAQRPSMCSKCKGTITIQNSFVCAFCQAAVVNGVTCPFCRQDHELSQLLVTANYEQPLVKSAIKNFKYRFIRGLAGDLSSIMANYLQKQVARNVIDLRNILIVPVPLSASRLRWRGFNQAELLAQALGKHFDMNPLSALKRIRNQKPQAEIQDRKSRIANMDNVFEGISPSIKGQNILLIDDISTTGSTLEACAKALKKSGANRITGFVFARN